jgi:serine/threonine protein kinase
MTEARIIAQKDAPNVPGGLYYSSTTVSAAGQKQTNNGGTPYAVLHVALDYRADILDRLDSLLAGTAISVDELDLGDEVARGQGGVVRRGTVRATGVAAAVKFSLPEHTNAVAEFREEAAFLVGVCHENVVALIGLSTTPPCIVMEWCGLGSLESWLEGQASARATVATLTVGLLTGICRDLLTGMAHLEALHCVHRDLAARNVLLTEGHRAKIADFGRSRRLTSENDYYRQKTKMKSPLRWMSPDAIKGKFSGKSDVWAYGVVCWETFTVGEMPYWTEGCYLETPEEVMAHIFSKDVLSQPPGCPDSLYGHMKSCWHAQPAGRPTFADLVAGMKRITSGLSNASTTA